MRNRLGRLYFTEAEVRGLEGLTDGKSSIVCGLEYRVEEPWNTWADSLISVTRMAAGYPVGGWMETKKRNVSVKREKPGVSIAYNDNGEELLFSASLTAELARESFSSPFSTDDREARSIYDSLGRNKWHVVIDCPMNKLRVYRKAGR